MNETHISQTLNKDHRQRHTVSLRTKILLGNLLIVLITVAVMGYFVFYRSQAANKFLVNQFDISVNREIENRLAIITSNEVNDISIFFSAMKNVIDTFGTTTEALLSNDGSINLENANWNAYLELKQLPNGSWDNTDEDLASIFLPARMEIRDDLARELVALKGLDFFIQGLLDKNPDIIAIYFGGVSGETVYYPNIDLAAIVPPDFNITERPWYINAMGISQSDSKVVWSVPYQDAALNGLVITSSTPVYNESGNFRGVAGLDIQLATVTERVFNLAIGKTGYGFLIDSEGRAIAMPTQGLQDFNLTEEDIQSGDIENLSLINRVPLDLFEVLAKMTSGQTGVRQVEINGSNRYIAYRPVPIVGYSLGIVVSEDELLQDYVETNTVVEEETRRTVVNAIGVICVLLSVAGLASYGIGNSITAPLEKLINVAKQVADGNLDATAEVTTGDETGILGNALNNMSSTAKNLVANLEELVMERTRVIERRFAQIQAVAEVGKAVAAQRDLEELLNLTTHLISSRFGFYHVGIFLLDPHSEYANLMAANSSGGKKMLEREHKLRVGTEGIVGTVASSGEARIALDVGEDAVYFDNPDLPQTRSEMALPLVAGGEVQGVLDVQSLEANAFSADDIPTLQILADQLAIAVQNARMLRDTQEALFTARKATGEISQKGWQAVLKKVGATGYIGLTHGEVVRSSGNIDDYTKQALNTGTHLTSADQLTVIIPVIVRGQTIGMLRLNKPPHAEPWTVEEISDLESLSDQISSTLESARLYSEAQQRAAREQTIGEITTSITAATEVDEIIRETVTQLGKTLQDADVSLRINAHWD
jgi:GAF domain-containing protein/HAMP domain-containing protein